MTEELQEFLSDAREYLDYVYRDGEEGSYDRDLLIFNLDQNINEIEQLCSAGEEDA